MKFCLSVRILVLKDCSCSIFIREEAHFFCWKSRNEWEWRLPLFNYPEKIFFLLPESMEKTCS
jgi:hypothetical protein